MCMQRAIQINIKIIDTFVQMRQWALDNKELSKRVADIENYLMNYAKDNNKEIEKPKLPTFLIILRQNWVINH